MFQLPHCIYLKIVVRLLEIPIEGIYIIIALKIISEITQEELFRVSI